MLKNVTQIIKAARVDLKSLFRLVAAFKSVATSDRLRTDCFNVFHHHLQKPVELDKCDNASWIKYIFSSLGGICRLGRDYFNIDATHRQRYIRCWPSIFKWLKAILEGSYFHSEEELFFQTATRLFDVAWYTRVEYFDQDDIFKFAVRIWVGFRDGHGTDHFSAPPLIACIARKVVNKNFTRGEELLHSCGLSAEQLVSKIIVRLKHATYRSSPIDVLSILTLIDSLENLVALTEATQLEVFSHKVGYALVSMMKEIVNVPNMSKDHALAIRSSQGIFHAVLLAGRPVRYAVSLIKAGALELLLKVAAHGFDDVLDPQSSSRSARNGISECRVLWQLMLCLPFRDVVVASQDGFHKLYTGRLHVDELLATSSKDFQYTWKAFETVLAERAVLLSLFNIGYAPENAACANVGFLT